MDIHKDKISIDKNIWDKNYKILLGAQENITELINFVNDNRGHEYLTKEELRILSIYEKEKVILNELIQYSENINKQ